jgi:phosphotriesterase-related protein
MKRRTFLQILTLGLAGGPEAINSDPAAKVQTVLGDRPARSLGLTLMHEHILVDFIGAAKIGPGRYNDDEVFRTTLPHLRALRAAGCRTLVECTPAFLGRDPALLGRLSRASGLHIITNTGLYGAADDKYVPAFAYAETAEQLAARWIHEYSQGIENLGIRPGIIKIGVDKGPLSEIDRKLVEAAAKTHLKTGLTIAAHTGDGIAALAELETLRQESIHPSAFIWVHAQNESASELHVKAAREGAWVEFDGIQESTRSRHIQLLKNMVGNGLLERVLISQDAGWYHVGEPEGGNYRPYTFLFEQFVPMLRESAFSPQQIRTLLLDNPRTALTPHVRRLP